MNTDAAFRIGDSHLICEDYATDYNPHNDSSRIVVCDGCSSSKMTDVGARLLALSTAHIIGQHYTAVNNIHRIANFLISQYRGKFPNALFDSTLLFAHSTGDYIQAVICGDGVMALKKKTGDIIIRNYEYTKNYPYYLSYELDQGRKKEWEKVDQEYGYIMSIIKMDMIVKQKYIIPVETPYSSMRMEKSEYEWIALFSDGVNSFSDADKNNIPAEIIISRLTDFKSFTGQFVNRRMNKFKKECIKSGWKHYDDISMAVMHIED